MSAAPALLEDVAVLYVDPRGPYPGLVRDCYDASRDARTYAGPHPVVAHPPCGPWSIMRHLSKETTKDCAPHALEAVRRWGGVLEHPRGSTFFRAFGLPMPGELPDAFGGYTLEVSQCDWGHPARKRTWLYVVGVARGALPPMPPPREPTHWASGSRSAPRGPVPPGIKVCSAQQRRRTPPAFAAWLLEIARMVTDRQSDDRPSDPSCYACEVDGATSGQSAAYGREHTCNQDARSSGAAPEKAR